MKAKTVLRKIFTQIELLIVIAIIAILASLLMPALGKARDSAKTSQCAGQLRQLGQGLHMYGNDFNSWLPCPNALWGHAIMVNCLVENSDKLYADYIPKQETFYCPYKDVSAAGMSWSPGVGGADTWISYEYLCWRWFATSPRRISDNPSWRLMCDLNAPASSGLGANHIFSKGTWTGAVTVYLGGHTLWRNSAEITENYTCNSVTYWY